MKTPYSIDEIDPMPNFPGREPMRNIKNLWQALVAIYRRVMCMRAAAPTDSQNSEAALDTQETTNTDAPVGAPQTAADQPRKTKARSINLAQLLAELDVTWANLRRDSRLTYGIQNLPKSEVSALKRLGPLVVRHDDWAAGSWISEVPFTKSTELIPSTIFIALNEGDQSTEEDYAPDFFFAVKVRKCPWMVARQPGQAFHVGLGWRMSGKIVWGQFYAFVRDGRVYPASWLTTSRVPVGAQAYARKEWAVSAWKDSKTEAEHAVRCCFSRAIALDSKRQDQWNVAVNKDGLRATFLIDKADTAYAFKDREITAVARDGKRKRIMHFVREHEQKRPDGKSVSVRGHIRGVREFEWHRYHVFITSPQHHVFATAGMTLAAESVNADEEPTKGFLTSEQFTQMMVDMEEGSNKKRKLA